MRLPDSRFPIPGRRLLLLVVLDLGELRVDHVVAARGLAAAGGVARARLLARPSVARAVDEARPYRTLFPLGAPDRD